MYIKMDAVKKIRKPKTPVDYQKGKIYMIEPNCEYDDGDVYYGSTTSTLVHRLNNHKNISNKCKSKILIDKYGRENIKIVLIKLFPCNSIDELNAEEGHYHRNNRCVNKQIAGRKLKEYYDDNKEHILARQNEYNRTHREDTKKYRADNKEHIKEYQKKYCQDNKETIRIKRHIQYEKTKMIKSII